MEDIIRDNVELLYKETDDGVTINVTLCDKYGHYEKEFNLNNAQAYDLLEALKSIENLIKKDEFD